MLFRSTAVNGRDSTSSTGLSKPPGNSERESSGPREPSTLGTAGERQDHDRGSGNSRPSPTPNHLHQHKRKRSESGEQQDPPRDSTGLGRGLLDRPIDAPPASNGAGSGSGSGSVSDIETGQPGPASGHRSDTNDAPSSTGPWPEYDSQLISQAQRAQQFDPSDAHLADALQREAQGQERDLGARLLPSGPTEMQPAVSSGYPSDRSPAAVQVAPKRKRVFSNRTKTGCMTCRRRKKKCDEQHPSCKWRAVSERDGSIDLIFDLVFFIGNNCIRGGFLCEGYTSRSMWQKPSSSKTPVPLQSKEGYSEISGQYLPEPTQHHDRPSGLVDHMDRKMRPAVVEEGERSAQPTAAPTPVAVAAPPVAAPPPPPPAQPQPQPQPQPQSHYTTSPTGTHASW